ncbi:hypothetical protein B0T26DRAFT_837247 [Lasiosphaeria miniovina]|uniref:Polysaccharide lyase family 20 protein n=1 Tax=Lasiosphaeria miniovina TaxID=1954250 RepID=A0AA40DKA6_9PEZI|nr:uncharacterized protein B0T26DRAFT_837247 [Lasiosphaeria miniovina]KAK0706310.1 hypothetical protein B0T26DRAFT_837247 [Lasiosphaeria miniovina]
MMYISLRALHGLALPLLVASKLLIDFNAARGDDPSKMGHINLEGARGESRSSNSPDLYIKSDQDWRGEKAAHFHREVGNIRAEYHALDKKTTAGETYFLGYQFAMGATPHALMVWQWKEYVANNDEDGGANIPLALEIRNGNLCFRWSASSTDGRTTQWSTPAKVNTVYTIGIEILAKSTDGHARVWLNGEPVTFTTTKSTTLKGNMFPGRSDPKVGAYRGEDVEVNTFVYQLQIGTSKADLNGQFFG